VQSYSLVSIHKHRLHSEGWRAPKSFLLPCQFLRVSPLFSVRSGPMKANSGSLDGHFGEGADLAARSGGENEVGPGASRSSPNQFNYTSSQPSPTALSTPRGEAEDLERTSSSFFTLLACLKTRPLFIHSKYSRISSKTRFCRRVNESLRSWKSPFAWKTRRRRRPEIDGGGGREGGEEGSDEFVIDPGQQRRREERGLPLCERERPESEREESGKLREDLHTHTLAIGWRSDLKKKSLPCKDRREGEKVSEENSQSSISCRIAFPASPWGGREAHFSAPSTQKIGGLAFGLLPLLLPAGSRGKNGGERILQKHFSSSGAKKEKKDGGKAISSLSSRDPMK